MVTVTCQTPSLRINVETDMLCIKAVDTLLIYQIHEVFDSVLHGELRKKVFQIGCQQQAIREILKS